MPALAFNGYDGGARPEREAVSVTDEVIVDLGDHPLTAALQARPERLLAHALG